MAWVVPHELEDVLYVATRAAIGDAPLASGPLTRAIVDRSARYTSERDQLAAPRDRVGDLAARAVFFSVADAMKIAIPLAELARQTALPARRPLRIIDLGAGCGAMSLGLLASVRTDVALEIVAIDRDKAALEIASAATRAFADRVGVSLTVTTRTQDVVRAELEAADLVLLGSVLNELPAAAALALVEQALAAVGEDGAVIVIEPALRTTSRALHELRDAVIARATGHVFAPCTRRGAPCPALADPDDWCHEDRALVLPPRTAALARVTHLRDGGMKFSYLVLRRAPLAHVEDEPAWRIVSAPRPAKGKLELIGCSERGRIPLRLLKRNRTLDNRELERADRGDVVVTSAVGGTDRIEITATDGVVVKAL